MESRIPLELKAFQALSLLCGLQGSGKTTHCGQNSRRTTKKHPGSAHCSPPAIAAPCCYPAAKSWGLRLMFRLLNWMEKKILSAVAKEALQGEGEGFDTLIVVAGSPPYR